MGLALTLLALGGLHVDAPVRPHHEGTVVYPALLIKHGARPLTDVAIQHPPMTAYVYAAGMGVGGERLVVTRWITLGAVTLEAVLLAWLIGQAAGVRIGAVVSLVWAGATQLIEYLFLPWSTHYGLICVLLALREAWLWNDQPAPRRLVWMGIWLGLSLAFRVNLGAAALLALLPAIAWQAWSMSRTSALPCAGGAPARKALWWRCPGLVFAAASATGGLLAGLIALHVGSAQGILRAVDFQRAVAAERSFSLTECMSLDGGGLRTTLLVWVAAFGLLGMAQARPAVAAGGLLLWLSALEIALGRLPEAGGVDALKLVPGLLGIAVLGLWRWRRHWQTAWYRRLVLVVSAGGATWTINFPLPGLPQAMWATSGALVAALHLAALALREVPARRQSWLWVAVLATVLVLVPSRGRTSGNAAATARVVSGFYAGMRGEAAWVEDQAAVRERIQAVVPPGEPVLVWRMLSLLYADLERPAAALPVLHFDRFTERMASGPAVIRETLERLERKPPTAIVIDTHYRSDAFPDWYRGTHTAVADWIARRYTAVWNAPNGVFRVLTPGAPPRDEVELHFRRLLLDFAPGDLLRDVSRETMQVLQALAARADSRQPVVAVGGESRPAAMGDGRQLSADSELRAAQVLAGPDRLRGAAAVEACLTAYRLVEQDGVRLSAEQVEGRARWQAVAAVLRGGEESGRERP